MKHINLSAYSDVEKLSRFTDESFKKYCADKLFHCTNEVGYVKRHMVDDQWKGRICEIGSGNSKLLYRFEQEGFLSKGYGIEVSRSRYLFAEKFKDHIGSKNVENINQDFLELNHYKNLDLVISVDITFQLIAALNNQAESQGLKWIYDSLRPGGFLVLELRFFEEFSNRISETTKDYKFWEEFPEHDPFEFVLAKIYRDSNNLLVWEKNFFERNTLQRSKFTNIFKPYNHQTIKTALVNAGFKSVEFSKNWLDSEDDNAMRKDLFIVRATK